MSALYVYLVFLCIVKCSLNSLQFFHVGTPQVAYLLMPSPLCIKNSAFLEVFFHFSASTASLIALPIFFVSPVLRFFAVKFE